VTQFGGVGGITFLEDSRNTLVHTINDLLSVKKTIFLNIHNLAEFSINFKLAKLSDSILEFYLHIKDILLLKLLKGGYNN
jgi:hypothetical protein